MRSYPITVAADCQGRVIDLPGLAAAGRSGHTVYPLDGARLIPLPKGSDLYLLPARQAVGFAADGSMVAAEGQYTAVAAFLPPGYTAFSLAACRGDKASPRLPLYCYCAVAWYRGKFHVPALRVDSDPKHDPSRWDRREVGRQVKSWLSRYPANRLIAHHGLVCALQYGCPNAINLFLRRWEAPVAVSGRCNATCQGCISEQTSPAVKSPHNRISFVPTVEEIVELAVRHLEQAPRAMISFGQGCEGEPLLQGKLIETAIRTIRRQTGRGTLHINTNGSLPNAVARLVDAGLDSIRISLNSARPALYAAYYRCRRYSFDDVLKSFHIARKAGVWISINYLTFPGVTDDPAECRAFSRLLEKTAPQMIQWRNLNIDPDWYMETVDRAVPVRRRRIMGIPELMQKIRRKFPGIRFGYFNPPLKSLHVK
ncbi:MAG: radical SAM protein [Verrucomicrobia bacterium]|nr:radical SAM protein [Verrucomicrobiota bacterium]MBU1734156.1 radical SAM protein [Verrucomicrobiota bacterium]MBU1856492.1 radical SAM protein [Verrucomicrobiota bacterium]